MLKKSGQCFAQGAQLICRPEFGRNSICPFMNETEDMTKSKWLVPTPVTDLSEADCEHLLYWTMTT